MGSLGDRDQLMVTHYEASADAYEADADAMKHMVMGMVAVALVFSTVFGALVLSDILHIMSSLICDSVDLPSLWISG